MDIKSEYIQKLLEVQNEHQKLMNEIVSSSIREHQSLIEKFQQEDEDRLPRTLGERVADRMATFGGSWTFIFVFFLFLTTWMIFNTNASAKDIFDPYPFILLNLFLSCLAAIQAPVILMSQNRKEVKERQRAQEDYLVNLKAELENRSMEQKLDLFINQQFTNLIDIQKVQIHKLEELEDKLEKLIYNKSSNRR